MPPAPLLQQMEEPVHFSRVCLKKYTHTYIYILTAFALIVLVRVVDLENTRRKSHEDAGCSWEAAWPQRPPSQTPRPAQSCTPQDGTLQQPELYQQPERFPKRTVDEWHRLGGNGNFMGFETQQRWAFCSSEVFCYKGHNLRVKPMIPLISYGHCSSTWGVHAGQGAGNQNHRIWEPSPLTCTYK